MIFYQDLKKNPQTDRIPRFVSSALHGALGVDTAALRVDEVGGVEGAEAGLDAALVHVTRFGAEYPPGLAIGHGLLSVPGWVKRKNSILSMLPRGHFVGRHSVKLPNNAKMSRFRESTESLTR